MNKHLELSRKLYESHDIDFQSLLGWHLCYGVVVSTPSVFALFYYSHSSSPETPVSIEDSDTLYATMCCGNMRDALELLKDNYTYLAFRRDFKRSSRNRLLNIKKFYSKLK
jgi:hypothetical protein